MPILTNVKFNEMSRELKLLRIYEQTMRNVLGQIAASRRGGLNKRLASSCLDFLKHTTPEQDKRLLAGHK
jgi:hypothetical protein